MNIFLGKPIQKIVTVIEKRYLPVPEKIFSIDSSGNVIIDEKSVNKNGIVQCFGTPNSDGTLTLTFDD